MEYLYILIILALFYYVIVKVVLPKIMEEEIEIIKQYEIDQIKNNLFRDMECFKESTDDRINLLKQGEIKELQQMLTEEMNLYKQQLALETKKTIVMYEEQSKSFKKIIEAMQISIGAIERDDHSGVQLFGYINRKDYQALETVVNEEIIFVGHLGRRWLQIFLEILHETIKGDLDEAEDSGMDIYVGIRYKQLNFIKEHITNYFCGEIGVSIFSDASDDIEILNACRLISIYYHREWLPQVNDIFRTTKEKSPYQLVNDAKEQLPALKQTLYQLKEYLRNEDRRYWYEKQFEVEKSLIYIDKMIGE